MIDKYLSKKELWEIPASNEVNQRIEEISEKYPILRELEEKLNYEQFTNLFFLVDRLYCYQLMWERLKKHFSFLWGKKVSGDIINLPNQYEKEMLIEEEE